jgi:hypothetical protein
MSPACVPAGSGSPTWASGDLLDDAPVPSGLVGTVPRAQWLLVFTVANKRSRYARRTAISTGAATGGARDCNRAAERAGGQTLAAGSGPHANPSGDEMLVLCGSRGHDREGAKGSDSAGACSPPSSAPCPTAHADTAVSRSA